MTKWFLKYAPQCLEFEEGLVDQLEESYDGVMSFRRDLRQFMDDNRNHIIGSNGCIPALLDAVGGQDRRFTQNQLSPKSLKDKIAKAVTFCWGMEYGIYSYHSLLGV